jgi:hypothetical protein
MEPLICQMLITCLKKNILSGDMLTWKDILGVPRLQSIINNMIKNFNI